MTTSKRSVRELTKERNDTAGFLGEALVELAVAKRVVEAARAVAENASTHGAIDDMVRGSLIYRLREALVAYDAARKADAE